MTVRDSDVVLVSMPFGPLYRPSIGLGLLKSALNRLGVPGTVSYFTLPFAERLGHELYLRIAAGYPLTTDLVGEWVFSHLLFPEQQLKPGFVENILDPHRRSGLAEPDVFDRFIEGISVARREADPFLDDCVSEILARGARIVGFTSVHPQQLASLALARRIKTRAPDVSILFGGPNCEGVMGQELARQFPFVDAVVSGEADVVFPELVTRLLSRQSIAGLPGVHLSNPPAPARAGRRFIAVNQTGTNGDGCASVNAPTAPDMDRLDYPDYSDFFEQAAEYPNRRYDLGLLMETSRGCWWGEKHHCSFCGMNGADMKFRSKSAGRAFEELTHLLDTYPTTQLGMVDNILDMKYFREFFPRLAEARLNVDMFYEVKPNLTKDQVRLMRKAGVTSIQPGIESFSNQVLTLMKKGVTGLQNIQLLKWCKELGIDPKWNILWGFPGEEPAEYARMAELVPLLTHLRRPGLVGPIHIVRFSPHFENADGFGFANLEPYPAYRHIYPFSPEVVFNLAFTFTYGYQKPQDVAGYTAPVDQAVRPWGFVPSYLFSFDVSGSLLICDLRPVSRAPLFVLTDLQRRLYEACDQMRSAQSLQKIVDDEVDAVGGEARDAMALMAPLVDAGLMAADNGRYLSLAIPLGTYSPDAGAAAEFVRVVFHMRDGASDSVRVPLPDLRPAGQRKKAAPPPLTSHQAGFPEPDSPQADWAAAFSLGPDGRFMTVDLEAIRRIRRGREDLAKRDEQRDRVLSALQCLDMAE